MPARHLSIDGAKTEAKRLRSSLAETGVAISHSRALELVARQHGHADWNTFHAALGNAPAAPRFQTGDRVRGHYPGQPFTGRLLRVETLTSRPGFLKVTVHFDQPVDVVTFESFSAFRIRVSATIDEAGQSPEKTSNGRPHMELREG